MDLKIVIKRPSRSDRELHQTLREHFEQLRRDTLELCDVIHEGNCREIELRLRHRELELVAELVEGLSQPRREPTKRDFTVCQTGDTCVPTSLANALILLDESGFFGEDSAERRHATHLFVDHFLALEPGIDGGERRSLDRVQHYFSNDSHNRLGLTGRYDFELTGSLLDMIFALYTGEGCPILTAKGHAYVAYGLYLDGRTPIVELKDPLVRGTREATPDVLADQFVWSCLAGLPYAVSLGAVYNARSAQKLIEDQLARDNLGVCCGSGILWKR